uniref:Kinesin motor domain-containing protein n=1 Tax=Biomphalaria glabrata TaxID=6526 RepID=A0A2C9LVQ8_BIOGL
MIATISPASIYYSDTISTLRYAQRAKTIVNKPKINEDENIRLIRELRAEIERLKKQLQNAQLSPAGMTSDLNVLYASYEEADPSRWTQEKLEEYQNKAALLLRAYDHESGFGSPPASTNTSSSSFIYKSPCLVFFNAEPGLPSSFELKHGKTFFGQGDSHSEDFKELQGEDVLQNHCHIDNVQGEIILHPEPGALCRINDQVITQPRKLNQGDQIQLGEMNKFQFRDKQLYFKPRASRSGSFLSVQSSNETMSNSSSYSDLPSAVDYYPFWFNPNMDSAHICLAVEKNHDNETERIEAAIHELQKLKRELDAQKEALDEREEKMLSQNQKAQEELQKEKQLLDSQEEAARREREKQEQTIEEQRRKLNEDKEKFERKLQQELQKIKSLSGNSDTLMEGFGTQTDELSESMLGQHDRLTPLSGQTGQEIRRRKISREGRYKDIVQKELLNKLHYTGNTRALSEQVKQVDEKYKQEHKKVEAKKREIKMKEARMRELNARELEYIHQGTAVIDQMAAQKEQLELYLEEKQDLQQVELDSPRPIRSAWSVTNIADSTKDDDQGFPSRAVSLFHVGDEQQGFGQQGMPLKANSVSSDDSEEEDNEEEMDILDSSECDSCASDDNELNDRYTLNTWDDSNAKQEDSQSSDRDSENFSASPSDPSAPFQTHPPRMTSPSRPSRGRSRVRRDRSTPNTKPKSTSPNLTNTAAAVTARLYQPKSPRPDLEGNYLRGSKDRMSSPSVSPVELSRSERKSILQFLSQDKPKHPFLKKGSKKTMTSPIHDPLTVQGKRSRDSSQESVSSFDFLRKGSRKLFKPEVEDKTEEPEESEMIPHDFLRRKMEEDVTSIRSQKHKEEEDMAKHDYLRRGSKQLKGDPHERTQRIRDVESKARVKGQRLEVQSLPHQRAYKSDESLTHTRSDKKSKAHDPHERLRRERHVPTHERYGKSPSKVHAGDDWSLEQSIPSHSKKGDVRKKLLCLDADVAELETKSRNLSDNLTLKRSHRPSGSQELTSSNDDIPKQKYLKKGSGNMSIMDQRNQNRPQFFKHVPPSKVKKDPKSDSSDKSRVISRSQSYPSVKHDDFDVTPKVKRQTASSLGGSDSNLHIIGGSPSRTRSKSRLVLSATCLASVPEQTSEEDELTPSMSSAVPDSSNMSALVAGVRRRSRQNTNDEWRRHSEPEGDKLATEFARYTADIEGSLNRDRPESLSNEFHVRSAEELSSENDPSIFQHSSLSNSRAIREYIYVPEIQVSWFDNDGENQQYQYLQQSLFPLRDNPSLHQPVLESGEILSQHSQVVPSHHLLNINVHGHFFQELDSSFSPMSSDSLEMSRDKVNPTAVASGERMYRYTEDEAESSNDSSFSDSLEESNSCDGQKEHLSLEGTDVEDDENLDEKVCNVIQNSGTIFQQEASISEADLSFRDGSSLSVDLLGKRDSQKIQTGFKDDVMLEKLVLPGEDLKAKSPAEGHLGEINLSERDDAVVTLTPQFEGLTSEVVKRQEESPSRRDAMGLLLTSLTKDLISVETNRKLHQSKS